MPCSKLTFKITATLHILSLITALIGMFMQVQSIKNNEPYSLWLPSSLAVVMLLRLPSQICVSSTQAYGWLSVVGSLFATAGYIYIAYISHNKEKAFNNQTEK